MKEVVRILLQLFAADLFTASCGRLRTVLRTGSQEAVCRFAPCRFYAYRKLGRNGFMILSVFYSAL